MGTPGHSSSEDVSDEESLQLSDVLSEDDDVGTTSVKARTSNARVVCACMKDAYARGTCQEVSLAIHSQIQRTCIKFASTYEETCSGAARAFAFAFGARRPVHFFGRAKISRKRRSAVADQDPRSPTGVKPNPF